MSKLYAAWAMMGLLWMVTSLSATTRPADFEGVWLIDVNASALPGEGPVNPQLTSWAAAEKQQREMLRAQGDHSFDLTARCSNPGVPRLLSIPEPIEIFVREDDVTISYEWNHLFRQIHVGGYLRTGGKEVEGLYAMAAGTSNGRWEGSKLVAITSNRNDKTQLTESIPNSDELKITEVYSLAAKNQVLNLELTIEDPKVLVTPWKRHFVFRRRNDIELTASDSCLDRVQKGGLAVPKGY